VTLEEWNGEEPDPWVHAALKAIARVAGVGSGALLGHVAQEPTGALAAMAGEYIGTALERSVDKTMQFQVRQAGAMISYAAEEADRSPDDLIDAADDPVKLSHLSQTLSIAATTALDHKLRVLGSLLVQGLLNDDPTQVDEARLLTAAIEEIERPHLHALQLLETDQQEFFPQDDDAVRIQGTIHPWRFNLLARTVGVSESTLELLLGTLSRHNLIYGIDRYNQRTAPQMLWALTDPGRAVLERFRRAGAPAVVQSAPQHDERAPQHEGSDVE
jgi:hypothetical protein